MSQLEEMKQYLESLTDEDEDGNVIYFLEDKADSLLFDAVQIIERYEKALKGVLDNLNWRSVEAERIAKEALNNSTK